MDTGSGQGSDLRASRIAQEVLAPFAGARHRVVDEHMVAPDQPGLAYSRCRLQVFSAPGLRSVAIAVQLAEGDGASLINMAERYARTVWRRFCSQEPEPPIWIQHLIDESRPLSSLVGFTVSEPMTLSSPPTWGPGITAEELAVLVGGPVDLNRGNWVARILEPEPLPRLEPATVFFLPRPDADADRACRPAGISMSRAIYRQFVQVRRGHDCWWYHGGDWHQVSVVALRGLRAARADKVDADEENLAVLRHAERAGMSGWPLDALASLVQAPIDVEEGEFINGRHRTQAMLDAGVHRTIVARLRMPKQN